MWYPRNNIFNKLINHSMKCQIINEDNMYYIIVALAIFKER